MMATQPMSASVASILTNVATEESTLASAHTLQQDAAQG